MLYLFAQSILSGIVRFATDPMVQGTTAGAPEFGLDRMDGAVLLSGTSNDSLITYLLSASLLLLGISAYLLVITFRRNRRMNHILHQRHTLIDKQKTDLELAFREMISLKDKAESANKARSGFLANISHELRTPLNGMIGLISLLKKTGLNDKQQEYVNDTELMARNMLTLVNDILDYSKFESGSLVLQQINFNLLQELTEVLQIFRKKTSEKNIQFISRQDTDLPHFVKGDPVRLMQILNNLLQNAVKFTDKGSIRVHISLVSEEGDRFRLRFSVTDTGCGISESEQKRIWDVFEMGDESYTRSFGGAGLGLAVSSKLASLMNGEMGMSSAEGSGSSFWFTVELLKGTEPDLLNSKICQKILVVEDNLINQKVSKATLQNLGYEVDLAENGKIAVDKFSKTQYDIVLMDIQMPMMDGIQATREIRKIEKEQKSRKRTHIVALTANSMLDDKKKCEEAGVDSYLSKPFNLEKFPVLLSQISQNGHY